MKRHRAGSLINAIEAQVEQESFVVSTPPDHPIVVNVPATPPEEAPFDPRVDPRPDLAADSALWTALLTAAAAIDGDVADGLTGALHGLRCCGARLVAMPTGVRLVAGEIPAEQYARWREEYLTPHREVLVRLLQAVRR